MKKKKAFTLAELLITLTTIGIIAALTIPAIVQRIQESQFRIKWKETYSIVDQATRRILTTNGGTIRGLLTIDDGLVADGQLVDLYSQYLNKITSCKVANDRVCWYKSAADMKYFNGQAYDQALVNISGLVLSNGALMKISSLNPDTNSNANINGIPMYAQIHIDVNGFKGPNTIGKDIFGMWLLENGLKPLGTQGQGFIGPHTVISDTCIEGSTDELNTGWGCGAKYFMQ